MSTSFLPKITSRPTDDQQQQALQQMILQEEAQIGGQLFGPVPKGHIRQFFNLDAHTWVWYEQWKDDQGEHAVTTRYEVRPDGVLKHQDGQPYRQLSDHEARNLYWATEAYRQQVTKHHQRQMQTA